ncbi:MAG: hypothetical protein M1381_05030 [Deltaproteobacteria bacterium]|nr:hypothetical protein [Deltaproteobacteria bacterium]MCL5791740.1 hypothetical protein [Deltaproteobacteria bacterium]
MKQKVLVIVSTENREKALGALVFVQNSLKNGRFEDLKLILFGPSEKLASADQALQSIIADIVSMKGNPIACKAISDMHNIGKELTSLGFKLEYVGDPIGQFINDGYLPMVF